MKNEPEHLTLARKALRGYLVSVGYTRGMASLMVAGDRKPSREKAVEIEQKFCIPVAAWTEGVPLQETWDFIVRRAS